MTSAIFCAVCADYLRKGINLWRCYSLIISKADVIIGSYILSTLIAIFLCITIIGIPLGIYLGVGWYFVLNVATLENCKIFEAMKRSQQLVKGNWWRVFGIYIFISILTSIIASIFMEANIWLGVIINYLFVPIPIIVLVLLYFDLRVRKEQYGLENLGEEFSVLEALADE